MTAQHALDYSTFSWLVLSDAEFAKLAASPVAFEAVQEPYTLTLGELRFDPLRDGLPAAVPGLESLDSQGPDLRLVQFVGPTQQEWLTAFDAAGVKVVQYIHPFTYVVWSGPDQLDAYARPDVVRWKGKFEPGYRMLPSMRGDAASAAPVEYRVLIAQAADPKSVVESLRRSGWSVQGLNQISASFSIVGMSMNSAQAAEVARIPGVYSVQTQPTDGGLRNEMGAQVNVNNVDGTNLAFPGYRTWLTGLGYDGTGVLIASVDGGLRDSHADLVNRVIPCVGGGSCGSTGTQSSHGTHTAGIMAGDGSSNSVDSFGFLRGLGVAPGANLVEQLYSPTFTQPGGMRALMTTSQRNGALLSGNSWGPAGTPRGYDNDTLQVDQGVRDADPAAPGNQPFTYVLSFMNGNGGTSTQGTPDEGKNLFTIGSTKLQNSSSGSQILQINDISDNSAHGPALDGRKIPHMVAPGCSVDSTDTNAAGYGLKCGTSMASPQVTGGVALFIEYYRNLPTYLSDPSPAMIKAAFLAVAKSLAGFRDADNGILGQPFDSKQGWGRFDLEAVVDPIHAVRYFDNPVVLDNTGEEWVQSVAADDPSAPIRIMLVWTDAPGHGLGGSTPAWNNDLDLIVEDGVDTYRGNNIGGSGWTVAGGVADTKNNTEGVFIGPTAGGSYTLRVRASNLNSDGIPNSGDATDQDFAVACYNCALEPGFTLAMSPAAQAVCAPGDAVYDVDIGQVMGFTDPVSLTAGGELGDLTAVFGADPVLPPGSTTLTISNTGAVAGGLRSIQVTGTSGALVRSATVGLTIYASVPGATILRTPADHATAVSLRPIFTWDSTADAATYAIDVATDAAFANIVAGASNLTAASWQPGADLGPGADYFWRVRGDNLCGEGAYAGPFEFTTRVVPAILLVDDDDNNPDLRSTYVALLQSVGQDFDVWNTNDTDNEPTTADLSPYSTVVWFTADSFGGTCGPGGPAESALGTWLNAGNRLFICSQDYHYDRGRTSFMINYLGVQSVTNDQAQTSASGMVGSIFEGLGPYALSYPFTNFSDAMLPDATAVAAFNGNAGIEAITKDNGTFKTVYFAFPIEAIPAAADRQAVLQRILDWFAPPAPLAGDMNCDGMISVADIGPFVLALTDPSSYALVFSNCDIQLGDLNDDGIVSVGDIGAFVALLTGG